MTVLNSCPVEQLANCHLVYFITDQMSDFWIVKQICTADGGQSDNFLLNVAQCLHLQCVLCACMYVCMYVHACVTLYHRHGF